MESIDGQIRELSAPGHLVPAISATIVTFLLINQHVYTVRSVSIPELAHMGQRSTSLQQYVSTRYMVGHQCKTDPVNTLGYFLRLESYQLI